MKVRAIAVGVHNNRVYHPGEVFEIEGKPHPIHKVDDYGNRVLDVNGQPIIEGHRPALADWMEEVKEKPKS